MTSNCSLLDDLQEPFRWIVDIAVVESFESRIVDPPDFYFTADDYQYRFEIEAKRRLLDLLRERFNIGAEYKGRSLKWDTIIEQKAVELGRYLVNRSTELDFSSPSPSLHRMDTPVLRNRIFSLPQSEAYALGIGKSTLYHLRRNAAGERPFRIYRKVVKRLGDGRTLNGVRRPSSAP